MQLTEEQLNSFIELYERKFGVKLTPKEAQEEATSLLYFMAMSLRVAENGQRALIDMPSSNE